MIAHISTGDTFYAGCPAPSGWSECPICGKMSKSQMGYTGIRHMCCLVEINEEDFLGSICKKIRTRILRMKRKELGKKLGYSPKTIKQYELVRCSRVYAEKLKKFRDNGTHMLRLEDMPIIYNSFLSKDEGVKDD